MPELISTLERESADKRSHDSSQTAADKIIDDDPFCTLFCTCSATTHSQLIVTPHASYRDLLLWPSEMQYIVQQQSKKSG